MSSATLVGSRVLIVEDEYFLADEARATLAAVGAEVVGPVPTAAEAQAVIEADARIDCVLLDINLRGEMAFEVADTLQSRRIPFAFVTGYDRGAIPDRFATAPRVGKPVGADQLVKLFEKLMAEPRDVR